MKAFFIFAGSSNIPCAILLCLSWFSIGIFMWNEISTGNYLAMVQNPAWLPVNVIYLLATLLLIPGIIALYLQGLEDKGIPGQFALWITLLAIIWYSCIQFYEPFFWPVITSESPLLFKEVGFNPSNTIIYTQLILSAVAWGAGFYSFRYCYKQDIIHLKKNGFYLYTWCIIIWCWNDVSNQDSWCSPF